MVNYLLRQFYVEQVASRILYAASAEEFRRAPSAVNGLVRHVVASGDLAPLLERYSASAKDLHRLFRCLRIGGPHERVRGRYLPAETLARPDMLPFALERLLGKYGPKSDDERQSVDLLRSYLAGEVQQLTPEKSDRDGDDELLLLRQTESSDEASSGGRERVKWEDVRELAEECFKVWTSDWQYHWAREAWSILDDAGLTSFDGIIERAEVYLRMLALGCLYRDFCDVAADERHYREDWMWATEVGLEDDVLHPFVLGMMVGRKGEQLLESADCIPEDYQGVVESLVDKRRREVCGALLSAYKSEAVLWAMLRLTTLRDLADDENSDEDPVNRVLSDVAWEDAESYSWVSEGCPVRRQSGE